MTAEEWWESVRDAASQIGHAEARMAALREPRGSGGHGIGSGIGDPTGRWAIAIADSERDLAATVREMEGIVGDGLAACSRVGAMMGQLAAEVMEARHIDCLTWEGVAYRCHVSESTAKRIRRDVVKLTDEVGIVHLVHGWPYES